MKMETRFKSFQKHRQRTGLKCSRGNSNTVSWAIYRSGRNSQAICRLPCQFEQNISLIYGCVGVKNLADPAAKMFVKSLSLFLLITLHVCCRFL